HPVARREEAKRPAEVAHHLRGEHPPCGKQAGLRGNVAAADAERRRELGGVEGTRSAEGHQREATRIPSTLDRDDTYRALHRRVRHRHHAGGRRLDGPSQPARERRDRVRRPHRVDPEIAAQELGLHESAEHEIRVRQSGSGAAPEALRPRAAARASINPPLDCMTRIPPGTPSISARRWRAINGPTKAFTTVVLRRSYSRYSRTSRWESVTCSPLPARARPRRRSCWGAA